VKTTSRLQRTVALVRHPVGMPDKACLRLIWDRIPRLRPGQVLIQPQYLAVDPFMRLRMSRYPPSYLEPYQLGHPIEGYVLGPVVESQFPSIRPGDLVTAMAPWQEFVALSGEDVVQIAPGDFAPRQYLSALGMPGLAAYVGVLDVLQAHRGRTLFVSSAAGTVGALAGQIGKILGCRVVGSTRKSWKVDYLVRELGFDAAFSYHAGSDLGELLRHHCPSGIDLAFENVGGAMLDAAIENVNPTGRIALCGAIGLYNQPGRRIGPTLPERLLHEGIRVQAFNVAAYDGRRLAFLRDMKTWLAQGSVRLNERTVEGLENSSAAFSELFSGSRLGRLLLHVA
jgi:NADPH-dependent curcumin reductase CurA